MAVSTRTVGAMEARTGQCFSAISRARRAAAGSTSPATSKRNAMRTKRYGDTSSCSEATTTCSVRRS